MRRYAIAVMARAPEPGRVKTRLVPPLSCECAANLYRCLLLDKLLQVAGLTDIDPYLAYTPLEARPSMLALLPDGFTLIPQAGSTLGDRLHRLSAILLERGHQAVILIDSDSPTLPTPYLLDAVKQLQGGTTDLVLGPTDDGGYYLIGLKRPCRALFDDIPWSSQTVLNETLHRATAQRLQVAVLPPWFDVDTPDDLTRLQRDLATAGAAIAPHTRRFLFG
ncbi:2-phospho-L-lactate guanylyltransferase [Candidatus Methylomirabilis lanthanidiphila]|uniref:2-phospho-L-lactate guanylyltransferase n=1 Tax=Candidatus Methylomirabilis lanthanidiphila TaxID=2211376 RepID=A0A564ZIL8_9BACT|nr:TIGR04282 family arsenosugar biosynthesis glycosyltransferase [Candidatus Methylomirabilis lanthanidiphila]VUZ85179.1 2-phospho-L-lactate guanylyltransferase [Candidatus Methylomirabilis lanthanidiphila]